MHHQHHDEPVFMFTFAAITDKQYIHKVHQPFNNILSEITQQNVKTTIKGYKKDYKHLMRTHTEVVYLCLSEAPPRSRPFNCSFSCVSTSQCSVCSSRSRCTLRFSAVRRAHSSSASSNCLFNCFNLDDIFSVCCTTASSQKCY